MTGRASFEAKGVLQVSAYSIIDVDTHVTETPDVWVDRVPARMRDKVPYVDVDKRGRQCWFLNGKRMSIIGLTATAGAGRHDRTGPPPTTTCTPAPTTPTRA